MAATTAPAAASKKKWLPVATITSKNEGRICNAGDPSDRASAVTHESSADDQRVADVHAGDGYVGSEQSRNRSRRPLNAGLGKAVQPLLKPALLWEAARGEGFGFDVRCLKPSCRGRGVGGDSWRSTSRAPVARTRWDS